MSADFQLFRIEAPHFVAGFIGGRGRVQAAAPILMWLSGRDAKSVVRICRERNWTLEPVGEPFEMKARKDIE